MDQLEKQKGKVALLALAAFLSVRIQESKLTGPVELGTGVLELPELLSAVDNAVEHDDEGHAAVAIVAAAISLCFDSVRTRHPSDPSSKLVGDVGAFDRNVQTLVVDVSSRALSDADVLLVAQQMGAAGVRRGSFVLRPGGSLDTGQLQYQARRLHGVELTFYTRASDLARLTFLLAKDDLTLSLAKFPRLVLNQMAALKVNDDAMKRWAALFSGNGEADG